MGRLVRKTSFSSGEVNKTLVKRVNLEKVQTGLEACRNMNVLKDGKLVNRTGTLYYANAKKNTGNVLYIEVPNTGYLVEVTDLNIRCHYMPAKTFTDTVTTIGDSDIPNLDYCISNKFVAIGATTKGYEVPDKCVLLFVKDVSFNIFDVILSNFWTPDYSISSGSWLGTPTLVATGTPSGVEVEYATTVVNVDGQETLQLKAPFVTPHLPISAGQYNTITYVTAGHPATAFDKPREYRFYRRPKNGGAYGYIGSSYELVLTGTDTYTVTFVDYGQAADYSTLPPISLTNNSIDIASLLPKTGEIIGGRLFIGNTSDNPENIYGSRTNHPFNFTKDFPLSDDASLLFKSGQTGAAEVLKIFDAGSLVVFTSVGIYSTSQRGPITPSNAILAYVGSAIINPKLKPIKLGNIILFVDAVDNSIKILDFSNNRQNYDSEDITVYSGHLFEGKQIISWAVQKYGDPIVWATMDDGSIVAFTLNDSQQLRAWTRGDFLNGYAEFVTSSGIGINSQIVFVVSRNGVRTIETQSARYKLTDKERVYVDGAVYKNLSFAALAGADPADLGLTATPATAAGWTGDIRIDSTQAVFDASMIGKIYRLFDVNGTAIDLLCKSVPATTQVIFTKNPAKPYDEFTDSFKTNIILYETFTTVTGLNHLEGMDVAVYADGSVVASPLNDIENLTPITVVGGQVTIPRAAFASVGLPFVWDVGTFEINSQDPDIALQAKATGVVYLDVNNTKGFYVGAYFPPTDVLADMRSPSLFNVDNPTDSALPPQEKTYEVTVDNDWKSNGRVCIRGVDPVPFELLAITANVTFS